MSNGRTRSDFVFSILGSATAAAGPEQSAAVSPGWRRRLHLSIPTGSSGWPPLDQFGIFANSGCWW